MISDDGTWHEKMRAEALSDPVIRAEYEAFKADFELAEQLKKNCEKRSISQQTVTEKMKSTKNAVA